MTDHSRVTTVSSRWRARFRRQMCDRGLTLVEVVVSVAVLALVIAPLIRIVISTGAAADQDRLRVEATSLATQDIENYENDAFFGVFYTHTVQTTYKLPENGGTSTDKFQVETRFRSVDESGTSVCASGSNSPQIWDVIATVSWAGDGTPVQQSTYVAPEQAGAVPAEGGSIAIPIDTSAATNTPYTGDVSYTVIGTWDGGGAPVTADGDTNYATGDTDSGCAVVNGLYPDSGWEYQVYLGVGQGAANPPTNQGSVEDSADIPDIVNGSTPTAPATEVPDLQTPASLTLGETTTVAPFDVAPATPAVDVTYETEQCTTLTNCTDVTTTVPPPTVLPVTAGTTNNAELQANAVFDTAGSTPISSISLFPYNDYRIWAGATNDSNPSYQVNGSPVYGADTGVPYDATASPLPTLAPLPIYPVILSNAAPPPGETLGAEETSAPGETIPLYGFSGTTSSTGLPLGQYELLANGQPMSSPQYIWVTPTGTWSSASKPMTTPTDGTFTAAGTAIPVVL